MAAALDSLFFTTMGQDVRRIAVLGDMRELGEASQQLHEDLRYPIEDAQVDLVFACGPFMRGLYDLLPPDKRGYYAETAEKLILKLLDKDIVEFKCGDVIMVKGSLGTRMAPIVEALKRHLADAAKTRER
jgi:UDP-N-acetylmuramoyl-L-alanyl-D-glutamate--2,6-diaminopimelate ligase/UDP-N-acetylmuramoyl-tripeptide--D-alanyl-D-alanine ligase